MAEIELLKYPDGNIVTQPVLRYSVIGLQQQMGLLQVIFAASREDFEAKRSSVVQLIVSPDLARGMAGALLEMANNIDPPPQVSLPREEDLALNIPTEPPLPASFDTDYRLVDEPFELRFDGDATRRDGE